MLKKKLLISYSVLIIFVLAVVSATVAYTISTIINSEMKETAQTSFKEGVRILENHLSDWSSAILEISVDEQLQEHLDLLRTASDSASLLSLQVLLQHDSLRLGRMISGEALFIYPVSSDGKLMQAAQSQTLLPFDTENVSWYRHFQNSESDVLISQTFSGNNSNILIVKNILSTKDWKTVVAVACVEVSLDNLNILLNQIEFGNAGHLLLANEKTVFLPFSRSGQNIDEVMNIQQSPPYIDSTKNMVFYDKLQGSNIYLVGQVSMAVLLSKGKTIQQILILTGIIAILIAMGFAIFFSDNITRPILRISGAMKNIRLGDLDIRLEPKGTQGEVKELCESFNYMMDMINRLINEVYVSKLNAKQAEIMALQAQINPHFLYNTLDSINWMAMKYNAKDIQSMVTSLAVMLRRTLNNGQNLISVRHEIEQLSSYIAIQKVRFQNLFEPVFMIDPSIMECTIIKLILQPLVENAIIHGFDEDIPDGKLFINGYKDKDTLVFDIINNGNLIDLEKIQNATRSGGDTVKSYGIKNVNDRLVQQYGSRYALHYFIEGEYTVARIVIPCETQQRNEELLCEDN